MYLKYTLIMDIILTGHDVRHFELNTLDYIISH